MKKLINIFLVALMIICLTGCHGGKETSGFEVPEEFNMSENYTITFWAKNDNNINQINVYKKAIEDFNTYYPNITVDIKLYTDYTRIYNDVITNISTDTTPNVCITYQDHIATYLSGNNTVLGLDELIDDSRFGFGGSEIKYDSPSKDEVIAKFLDELYIGDNHYGLPFMRSTEALYINEDFVEKLGYEIPDVVTWDWIWEVSEASMAKDSDGNYLINNQKVWIPFIYKSTDNMMIQMLKQKNADYTTDNGDILLFNDDAKEIMYDINGYTEEGCFNTFKNVSYPANYFNAGQCLFCVDSTAGSTWMGSEAPLLDIAPENVVNFKTAVVEIPQYDTENVQMISQGPSICIFNKSDPGEVLASWIFAQYLLSNDVQLGYSETEGYIPVTSKAQESEEYKDYLSKAGLDGDHYDIKILASELLLNNIGNTFITPVFNGSASVRQAAGQLIESAAKRAIMKKEFNDQFVQDVFDNCVSLYHLDSVSAVGTSSKAELGPLPVASKALLITLGVTWIGIGIYTLFTKKKKKVS